MELNLEDPKKAVSEAEPEIYRAVYQRRGSEFVIAVTDTYKVQVTKRALRKNGKVHIYHHNVEDIKSNAEGIKEFLKGYQLVSCADQPSEV
jgi:hypothetical protein